ncbi:MAG: hypothetical protein ACKO63_15160 [Nodosilinea sp.]
MSTSATFSILLEMQAATLYLDPMPAMETLGGEGAGFPLASPPSEDPNAGLRIPPNLAEGLPIQRVFIYLVNPSGEAQQDAAWRRQLADTFRIPAGGNFSPLFADQGLNQVQRLPFVAAAEYRLYQSNLPGSVIVALLVTLAPQAPELPPEETPGAGQPQGMGVSGILAQNFLLQAVGAVGFPGQAIRQAVGGSANPWVTLQLSLFMFF